MKITKLLLSIWLSLHALGAMAQRQDIVMSDGRKFTLVQNSEGLVGVEKDGQFIVPQLYTHIKYSDETFLGETGNKFTLHPYSVIYNHAGQAYNILEDHLSDVVVQYEGKKHLGYIFKDLDTDRLGFLRADGKIIIPPSATAVDFREKDRLFSVRYGRCLKKLINLEGQTVMEGRYRWMRSKPTGYLTENGPYEGFLNDKWVEIIPADKYTDVEFDEKGNVYNVRCGEKAGILDAQGQVIIPADKYTDVLRLANGNYCVMMGKKSGVCDAQGKELFFTSYNNITYSEEKKAYISELNGKNGVLDLTGKVIQEPEHATTRRDFEICGRHFTCVSNEMGLKGVLDDQGKTLLPCTFDYVATWGKDPYLRVLSNGYCGLYDLDGQCLIPCSEGYCRIYAGKEYLEVSKYTADGMVNGLCDFKGNVVIPADKYQEVKPNKNGTYKVFLQNKCGVIDRNGKVIVPVAYENVEFENTFYETDVEGKYGIYGLDGIEIAPPEFSLVYCEMDCGPYEKGQLFKVFQGEASGLYDHKGKVVFPVSGFTTVYIQKKSTPDAYSAWEVHASLDDWSCQYELDGTLIRDSKDDAAFEEATELADQYFKKRKYKKSAQYYKKACSFRRDFYSYYNTGVSYYNLEKWNHAIRYLREALKISPSDKDSRYTRSLIAKAEGFKEERANRRGQAVLGILGGLANLGAAIATDKSQYQNNSQSQYSSGTYSSSSADTGSSDYDSGDSDVGVERPRQRCGVCGGEGSTVEYSASFGLTEEKYCDKCEKTVPIGHYHKTCIYCNGKGYR